MPDENKRVGLEKRFELSEGYIKTVLSLSTGALVLSLTFLHDVLGTGAEVPAHLVCRDLLLTSWLGFLGSIAASLFYLYFLALAAKYEKAFSSHLKWGAIFSIAGFLVGLLLLTTFAWRNLP